MLVCLQTQLDATAAALAAKEAALYAGQHRQQLAALRAQLEALQGTTDNASLAATTVQAVASDNAMRGSTCKSLQMLLQAVVLSRLPAEDC